LKYEKLGRTGLTVSRIALGCMSYGSSAWRPWVLDEAAAMPFFRRAIELGVNFFDTADMYSLGASEEVTGKALREYARLDEVVLATKVYFPVRKAPNVGGLSRKHIVQSCEASLRRLGVDTIDLYQIHRFDETTPIEETLAALDHLVRSGKVRYLGASSMEAYRFAKMLYTSDKHGLARFISMQNHYNLLYREEEREMLPLCVDEGVGSLPWSPLARGLLAGSRKAATDKAATTRAESDDITRMLYTHPSDDGVIEAVRRVASARGAAPAEVSLAWLLTRPAVVAPIVGATKIEHLEAAARAVDLTLSADEIQALESPYQAHPAYIHK
jgi:1-deoxyxylulose-5-phosphate synthase